ncbi:hypothetical protein ONZ45_g10659 [Pleurotus djamor]|nr:hypothetical protein ONZ45_g10659 [Pleurotus djamor]
MQSISGLVISGSTVLNFLRAESNSFNDLDLYVDVINTEYVGVWLESTGCIPHHKFEPVDFLSIFERLLWNVLNLRLEDVRNAGSDKQKAALQALMGEKQLCPGQRPELVDGRYYSAPHILQVMDFMSPKKSRIQLVICVSGVMDTLLRFHSTHVMNFVTAEACYCLFPRETIEKKLSLVFKRPDYKTTLALKKYYRRGWSYLGSEVEAQERGVFPKGTHTYGGTQCLRVPLLPVMPELDNTYDLAYRNVPVTLVYDNAFSGDPSIVHNRLNAPREPTDGSDSPQEPSSSCSPEETPSPSPSSAKENTAPVPPKPISKLSSVENFNEYIWSHERCLRNYILPTKFKEFRSLQTETGMVISGYSALAFLTMVSEAGHELDLYVQKDYSLTAGYGLERIGCVAITSTGAKTTFIDSINKFAPINPQGLPRCPIHLVYMQTMTSAEDRCPRYFVRDDGLACTQGNVQFTSKVVYAVINFVTPLHTKINLVVSICPITTLITYFHSTILMNVITANCCYSFFPRETVVDRTGLAIQSKDVYQGDARAKFRSYGYKILSNGMEACKMNLFYPGPRAVSLGNMLSIPLVRIGSLLPSVIDYELQTTKFMLVFTGQLFADAKISCIRDIPPVNTNAEASGTAQQA